MLSDLKQMQAKNLTLYLGRRQSPVDEDLSLQEAMPKEGGGIRGV